MSVLLEDDCKLKKAEEISEKKNILKKNNKQYHCDNESLRSYKDKKSDTIKS